MTGDAYEDEDGRTFVALPPARGRGFAVTWWGRAWVKALEDGALDTEQLRKGRRQARDGAVGAVSVRPGRITAVVRDRDGTGQRGDVLLPELTADAWERFLDTAVDRAGHIAALLERDMPPHLVEDAAEAGVALLPGIGELEPECGCGAWDLCPHTAALCYQVARLLDQDPFVLLLLRGRGERRLLDELQVRSAARAERPGPESGSVPDVAGVPAGEAFAAVATAASAPGAAVSGSTASAPLAAPPLPEAPGLPPSLDTGTDAPEGIDPAALRFLATDAAVRARRMLAEALSAGGGRRDLGTGAPAGSAAGAADAGAAGTATVPVGLAAGLTVDQDAVRLAATACDGIPTAVAERLAAGSGRGRAGFEAAVRAWRYGGAAGLAVLDGGPVAEDVLARAAAHLRLTEDRDEAARPPLRAAGAGRWTVRPGTQLRVGADGRWWVFTRAGRAPWSPAGPPSPDPASALASLTVQGPGPGGPPPGAAHAVVRPVPDDPVSYAGGAGRP
ncbi:SWIM zinc finger family protein [Streptomyces sp. WMMC940]|uniref:SWIM zinc finger family protein n=1 Tax=Streptomyces sp. WMMC940 TaxID=3015153 RepID=UPI0022B6C5D8|nr:SWF or SNF family helicase [Streptomyces sp. WMMC940]MCZ7456398.1 SWF or SNF family helicase [Streptomyces sp. WMMC940]